MNPSAGVDWFPALVVLATGIVFGAVVVWRVVTGSRPLSRTSRGVPVEVRDLAGKSEALLRQLRELDDSASKRTPEQLARERYALEIEAAQTLIALDERQPADKKMRPKNEPAEASPPPPQRPGVRGFLWGVGSATGLLLLAFFVYQSAKPREAGGSVTGEVGLPGRPAPERAAVDGEEARLQAAIERNPDDMGQRLALTRLYVERQEWMKVWNETGRVLERAPGNPQALAYQALVRLAMGQTEVAANMLTKAVATDPDLVDGYVYLALAHVRSGRTSEADKVIGRAVKRFPDRAQELKRFLADVKTRETPTAPASAASSVGDPHAGLGTPGEGAQAPAQVRAAKGPRVAGTVDIDPSLRNAVGPTAVLFVFVRESGANAGPPVAVKRLPARFPASFELSEADSMMGQPFPEKLLIEARLDEDGDPTTRPATDPKARLDPIKLGRTDLRLVLKR